MSARLTASVVGGGTGGKLSMRPLAASEQFELVAAADVRPDVCEALKEEFPGIRIFTSHKEMFAECPTDIVCVSTWPPSHEEITLDALRLPLKGILVEKPLGHTAASGRRLLEAVKDKGLPMAVPHNMLTLNTPLEIISRVRGGEIGDLKLVEIQCNKWDIMNAGIHWLNFFVNLTGNEPMAWVMAACESSTRTFRDGMQVETTSVVYGQTAGGVRVVMESGDEVNVGREGTNILFRIVGSAGLIEFWGWKPGYYILNAAHPKGENVAVEKQEVAGHRAQLENMARMIDSGKPDYAIPDSALLALEICEGAYVSNRHRCKVTFPVAKFAPPPLPDWDPGVPYSGHGGGRDGRNL